jgi:hypothetical protein
MTRDIVKLADHLRQPIDNECKVVYLLAEVRKLLDRYDPDHNLDALWMYCHWALHVDLESPKTTEVLLEKVDRWITNTVAYLTPRGSWSFKEEYNLFKDFVYLSTFRHQLGKFLAAHKLPTDLCNVDEQWHRFIREYAGVIEDGTLSFVSKNKSLCAVDVITFTKGNQLTSEHHVPFVILWKIQLKDGRTLKTSVETTPSGFGNMTSHYLEIINNGFVPPAEPTQP